jgi:low affinity Fe/Cu permease
MTELFVYNIKGWFDGIFRRLRKECESEDRVITLRDISEVQEKLDEILMRLLAEARMEK